MPYTLRHFFSSLRLVFFVAALLLLTTTKGLEVEEEEEESVEPVEQTGELAGEELAKLWPEDKPSLLCEGDNGK